MVWALGCEPSHDGGDVLFGRGLTCADPVEHIEADFRVPRVKDDHAPLALAAVGFDHVSDFPGRIKAHHRAAPAQASWDDGRDRFEAARAPRDEAVRRSSRVHSGVVCDQWRPAALAPGERVLWIEVDAGPVIPI